MMEKEDFMEVIITGKKNVRWYFQTIMYESMLNGFDKVVLSSIYIYKIIAEQVVVALRMWGWELENLEENPYKEVTTGREMPLTYFKYSLIQNPTIKAIMAEILKERKSKDVLLYLLSNLKEHRIKNEELMEEFMKEKKLKDFLGTLIGMVEKYKRK